MFVTVFKNLLFVSGRCQGSHRSSLLASTVVFLLLSTFHVFLRNVRYRQIRARRIVMGALLTGSGVSFLSMQNDQNNPLGRY